MESLQSASILVKAGSCLSVPGRGMESAISVFLGWNLAQVILSILHKIGSPYEQEKMEEHHKDRKKGKNNFKIF